MGDKHKRNENPIEKLKEWQENQYNPGYYTGGKIPPYAAIPSKTSLFTKLYTKGTVIVGAIHILAGAALIFIGVIIFTGQEYREIGSLMGNLFCVIVIFGGLGVLVMLYGLKYIRSVRPKGKRKS